MLDHSNFSSTYPAERPITLTAGNIADSVPPMVVIAKNASSKRCDCWAMGNDLKITQCVYGIMTFALA